MLNARYHEQEAYIVAQAGRFGGVTIATNMAGRGTDIQLGGNPEMRKAAGARRDRGRGRARGGVAQIEQEVVAEREKVIAAGGLYVLGTERHESRRIDNQLRGRSGRQGDPGRSKFFLSLEDDLMRIFGSERMDSMLGKLGLQEDEAIIHPWINKALEKAQQKVEARNFEIRKNLLKFDDVMNDQRKVIYEQRHELIEAKDVSDTVHDMRHQVIEDLVAQCIPEKAYPEQWDVETLARESRRLLALDLPIAEWAKEEGIAETEIRERLIAESDRKMAQKVATYGPELMRMAEKSLLLQILDHLWKEHLLNLDHLRQGIHLRGYGQRDPLNEYKREAFVSVRGHADQSAPDRDPGDHAPGGAHAAAAGCGRRRRGGGAAGGDRDRWRARCRARRVRRRRPGRPWPQHPRRRPAAAERRAGARWDAMRPARAGRARSTSTATAGCTELAGLAARPMLGSLDLR